MSTFEKHLLEQEEKQLFNYVRQFDDLLAKRDLAWMRFMRATAIRVGPLSQVTVSDAKKMLRESQLIVRAEINKNNKGHRCYMNKRGQSALRDLLRIRRQMTKIQRPDDPLILSQKGNGCEGELRALSVRSFQDRMKKWVSEAGLRVNATPHWFRYTKAVNIAENSQSRDPLAEVQKALGHSNRSTSAIYAQPNRQTFIDTMEAS